MAIALFVPEILPSLALSHAVPQRKPYRCLCDSQVLFGGLGIRVNGENEPSCLSYKSITTDLARSVLRPNENLEQWHLPAAPSSQRIPSGRQAKGSKSAEDPSPPGEISSSSAVNSRKEGRELSLGLQEQDQEVKLREGDGLMDIEALL